MENELEPLRFLSPEQVRKLVDEHGAPIFVGSRSRFAQTAEHFQKSLRQHIPESSVSYAMKANPHPQIIKTFDEMGLSFDTSSEFEAQELLDLGVSPSKITLNAQQLPRDPESFIKTGVFPIATSLHQLKTFCSIENVTEIGVRINPGFGSGINKRLTVAGENAGFGIWYEYIDEVLKQAKTHGIKITKLHTHIGTGTDPESWIQAADITFDLIKDFPDIKEVNLGGGFKVPYMQDEIGLDLYKTFHLIAQSKSKAEKSLKRKFTIGVEPGRYLSAANVSLVAEVIDITDTGKDGYKFLRINTGMDDIIRPSMYGAQHPIVIVPKSPTPETESYLVVGHNCESSDMLTTAKGNPEELESRKLTKAKIGDIIVIEMAGAYCASMRAVNYNGFPGAKEIFID